MASSDPPLPSSLPTVCLVIGMAGSGKTTLMQRINAHVHEKGIPSYVINLDPAVRSVPYFAHVDIRDTVKYKAVMSQYGLGPNGAILTSLNLFATRFDQVMALIEKRVRKGQEDGGDGEEDEEKKAPRAAAAGDSGEALSEKVEETAAAAGAAADASPALSHVFVDTPGQIEAFTWSASGSVITESLSTAYPTCVLYVVDTPRSSNPVTFMSNMMYACSIMYRTRLPFVLVFNKADVQDASFASEWMSDFDAFSDALRADKSYMSTLTRSLSLVLEEFYASIESVALSAVTGVGVDRLFDKIGKARAQYEREYLPSLRARAEAKRAKEAAATADKAARLRADMESDPALAAAAAAVAGVAGARHGGKAASRDRVFGATEGGEEEAERAASKARQDALGLEFSEEEEEEKKAGDGDGDDDDAAAAAAGEEEEEDAYDDSDEESEDRREFEKMMADLNLKPAKGEDEV